MKWLISFFIVLIGLTEVLITAQTPRSIPVINLDANPHTITQNIWCDGDRFVSLDTYVDGQFLMTTYFPPVAPSGLTVR